MYNAQLGQFERYTKALEKYNKRHGEALGVLNQSLDSGIWEQVKEMTPAQAWTWLRTTYATQQFVEVFEDFKILTSFKIDLSDPNIQIAKFRYPLHSYPSHSRSSCLCNQSSRYSRSSFRLSIYGLPHSPLGLTTFFRSYSGFSLSAHDGGIHGYLHRPPNDP